jgi:tetratricopeptide (TPR) repeat protein
LENAHYLSGDSLEVIPREGTCWIPVETTILSQGFMAAWTSASSLVRKYAANGPFEFITLAAMRDSFPPLPLPPSTIAIVDPVKAGVDRSYATSLDRFTGALYGEKLKGLDEKLAALSGRQAVKVRVQEGVLHAVFGKLPQAEEVFRKAILDDPGLASPYVNLANIRMLASDGEGALQIVKKGLEKNGDSPLLNLLAARIYAERNDSPNVAVYFARAKSAAPELAARYPDLAASGGSPQRASQAGEMAPVIWGVDP